MFECKLGPTVTRLNTQWRRFINWFVSLPPSRSRGCPSDRQPRAGRLGPARRRPAAPWCAGRPALWDTTWPARSSGARSSWPPGLVSGFKRLQNQKEVKQRASSCLRPSVGNRATGALLSNGAAPGWAGSDVVTTLTLIEYIYIYWGKKN